MTPELSRRRLVVTVMCHEIRITPNLRCRSRDGQHDPGPVPRLKWWATFYVVCMKLT